MAEFLERCRHVGAALQRHADAEHRQRQAALFKLAQQPPHARARAVFIDAFHAQVALGVGGRTGHFGQKLLAAGIAVQHRVLAAFFVVQHKLHRDAGPAGPLGMRRVAAVASQVAWIGGCHVEWIFCKEGATTQKNRHPSGKGVGRIGASLRANIVHTNCVYYGSTMQATLYGEPWLAWFFY